MTLPFGSGVSGKEGFARSEAFLFNQISRTSKGRGGGTCEQKGYICFLNFLYEKAIRPIFSFTEFLLS